MNLNLGLGLVLFFNFFVFLPYLLFKKRRLSRELGIPKDWKLIYTDAQGEGRLLKAFVKGVILCGKPDWVYQNRSQALVIEDKRGTKPGTLYLSYQIQLAAYFLLVEEEFGLRPYRGILRFSDGQAEVSPDPTLIHTLGTVLEEMRAILLRKTPARRNHWSQSRCRRCKFYERCDERL